MTLRDAPRERMPTGGESFREGSRFGELLKQAATLGGVCYVFGFIIVNSSLGNLGIYDFSLTSSRLVAAGLLYLLLSLLSGVGWLAVLLVSIDQEPLAKWSKKRLYATTALAWVAGVGVGFGFYSALWIWLGYRMAELGQAAALWTLCNTAALVLLVVGGLYSMTDRGGLIWPALGLVLLVVALSLFGSALHSKIPGRLGGGRPLRVQLLVKPESAAFLAQFGVPSQALPRPVGKPGEAWTLTGPVDLVDSGSEAYVLETGSSPPRALLLARDNVQGIAQIGSAARDQ